MARRTKDDAEKTRKAIIDAAEQVFFAQGVSRSSLEQVARAAKVTRGAVYWHFKNKAELCDAMLKRIFLPQEDMLEKLAAESESPLEDLRSASIHALEMIARDKRRRRVVTILYLRCEYMEEMLGIIRRRNASKARMLSLSEKLFARAKALGRLSPCWDPRRASQALQAMMIGIVVNGLEIGKKSVFTNGASCIEVFFNSLQVRC
ncbi:MAG: TetR family transcriptional regulator [Alphaproteobacteria bacterium]|nr:TetR family transcriptional regulator [Alphaproteobacteria bacterium]